MLVIAVVVAVTTFTCSLLGKYVLDQMMGGARKSVCCQHCAARGAYASVRRQGDSVALEMAALGRQERRSERETRFDLGDQGEGVASDTGDAAYLGRQARPRLPRKRTKVGFAMS